MNIIIIIITTQDSFTASGTDDSESVVFGHAIRTVVAGE